MRMRCVCPFCYGFLENNEIGILNPQVGQLGGWARYPHPWREMVPENLALVDYNVSSINSHLWDA